MYITVNINMDIVPVDTVQLLFHKSKAMMVRTRQKNELKRMDMIDNVCNYNLKMKNTPLLFAYGVGLVIIYLISPYLLKQKYNLLTRFIIYFIIFTLFEYIISILSQQYHGGKKTWKYDKEGRQIGLIPSLVWTIFALIAERGLLSFGFI